MDISVDIADEFLNKIPNCLRDLQKDKDSLISIFPKEIVELVIKYTIPRFRTIEHDGGDRNDQSFFTIQSDSEFCCMMCGEWFDKCLIICSINCGCEPTSLCQNCINNLFTYC